MDNTFDAVPVEMKEQANWITWEMKMRQGKPTKIPFIAGTNRLASSTDPDTWTTFEKALPGCPENGGLGYVFQAESGICGIDIDKCITLTDGKRAWTDQAKEILLTLNSYSEYSPSGQGVHIYIAGMLPPGRRRKGGVEMYDRGRFFTVTGRRVARLSPFLEDRQEEIDAIHSDLFGEYVAPAADRVRENRDPFYAPNLDDMDLISKACQARNGQKFSALYSGEWQPYFQSQSEADFALCRNLMFWCGRDTGRVDRLFRMSGLYRDKWDTRGYGQRTLSAVAARM